MRIRFNLILGGSYNGESCLKRDKVKEKIRLKKLEQRKQDLESGKLVNDGPKRPTASVAWSNQKERKLKRKIRKEKHSLAEKKRKNEFDQEEYDELQNDFKLLKKLKKKKVRKIPNFCQGCNHSNSIEVYSIVSF